MSERRIRAILFDVGDTLWHSPNAPSNGAFRLAAVRSAAYLKKIGINGIDAALAARIAWQALEDGIAAARDDLRERDYGELVRAALTCHGVSLTYDQATAFLDTIYVSGPEGGKVAVDGARQTLLALRARGFLLGMVTNRSFGGERFRADLRATGLDVGWEAESVSVEVGYRKPHRAVFEYALDQLGVRAQETLMVGDSLEQDIAGAQSLGMATAWRVSVPDAAGVVPDFTFSEVPELLDLGPLRGPA